jgi:hypothetical protein
MSNHKAILALNPSVVLIRGAVAYDDKNNVVIYDEAAVNAWVDPDQYKYSRATAYPSIADQLDTIYHEGLDAWKATILAVKEEFPKP